MLVVLDLRDFIYEAIQDWMARSGLCFIFRDLVVENNMLWCSYFTSFGEISPFFLLFPDNQLIYTSLVWFSPDMQGFFLFCLTDKTKLHYCSYDIER